MAAYVQPQVLVFQEFNQVAAGLTQPLRACIVGPNAQLFRYDDPDEKATLRLGDYADYYVDGGDFLWPGRPAGGIVDPAFVKLYIDNAKLRYFTHSIGVGEVVAPVSGKVNRVRLADVGASGEGFTENGDYPRAAALLDRDVAVGDYVYIRGVGEDDEIYELNTYITDIAGEVVAASVAWPEADSANADSQTSASTVTQVAGPVNCLAVEVDLSEYNGLVDGYISETYTLSVVGSSTNENLTTGLVRLSSASGADQSGRVRPAAVNTWFSIGNRGLRVRFTLGEGSSCSSTSPETANDILGGQEWELEIAQTFEASRAHSGGTYTGDVDTKYIVEVTRGGYFDDEDENKRPQIKCVTVAGTDASGPTVVSAASTAVLVGTQNVTISFFGSGDTSISYAGEQGGTDESSSSASSVGQVLDYLAGLRKGDKFYIDVTAAAEGRMSTLVLGHNLPDAITEAEDLDLQLFIRKDLQVTQNREGFEPDTNWEVEDVQLVVHDGIIAYDPTWTDNGVEQALPVVAGEMFVEYRAWLPTLVGEVNALSDPGDLSAIPGQLSIDNPLKWGVYKALTNSNGTAVKYIAVADPADNDAWVDALGQLVGRDDVYGLVPLTRDQTVIDLFVAHVNAQSGPDAGRWRVLWTSLEGVSAKAVVSAETSSDEELVLATLADDPDASGTQYTRLVVPAGNGDFVTNGVRPGDTVRYLYTSSFGETSWTEFVVDEVINEDTLRLLHGHSAPVNVAQKVEIWHPLTRTEMADEIGEKAAAYGARRVRAVWPDVVGSGDVSQPGYYLCAGLAGLRSGVVPQQGLTNVELSGFDDLSRTTDLFNQDQLNRMADSGVWIVTRTQAGSVVTRHALTTDRTDVNSQEEMVVTNVDAMSFYFQSIYAPYIGRSNVTPTFLNQLRAITEAGIAYLKTSSFVERIGPQLIEGVVTDLRQHTVLKDRIVVAMQMTIPYPANNIEVHLVI